jgi:hypothetical protein
MLVSLGDDYARLQVLYHFSHSTVLAIESFALRSGRTSVRAEGISIHQQLKKKSAATALNTVLASAYT